MCMSLFLQGRFGCARTATKTSLTDLGLIFRFGLENCCTKNNLTLPFFYCYKDRKFFRFQTYLYGKYDSNISYQNLTLKTRFYLTLLSRA